jgi:hypothetical protein
MTFLPPRAGLVGALREKDLRFTHAEEAAPASPPPPQLALLQGSCSGSCSGPGSALSTRQPRRFSGGQVRYDTCAVTRVGTKRAAHFLLVT